MSESDSVSARKRGEVIPLEDSRFDRRESDAIPWTRADLRMLIELNTRIADLGMRHERSDEKITLQLMELTARVTSLEATRYQQQGAVVAARIVQPVISALMGLAGAALALFTGLGQQSKP